VREVPGSGPAAVPVVNSSTGRSSIAELLKVQQEMKF
jgi:hypothetical protein